MNYVKGKRITFQYREEIFLFTIAHSVYSYRIKPNLELKLQDFGPDPDDCFLGLTLGVKPSVSNSGTLTLNIYL